MFMGTPDFAVPTLLALLESGHEIIRVYTQPPRPAGRGHAKRESAVNRAAIAHGLAVSTPNKFDDFHINQFQTLGVGLAIVVAYGLMLPLDLLSAPAHGCLNLHASLLPRWRGAAPIQRAIMAGDTVTGVTAMQMNEELDCGPLINHRTVPITSATTYGDLHNELAELSKQVALETLAPLVAGDFSPIPQNIDKVTYAPRVTNSDCRINWRDSASSIERCVRAFNPSPGAWFEYAGERIKLLKAESLDHKSGDPGAVLDDKLTIACGVGAIRMLLLQRPGRKILPAEEFRRGFKIPVGTSAP